jgi:predicted Zn-dependent peptidase
MSVKITKLPNGLTVATDPAPHLKSAAIGVWVDVGARHEPADLNGVSHMLEHMAFKGTARRSARAIAEEIEAVGGHLNAYTSREQTAYVARVLSEDVPLAVDILGDILQNSVFDQTELERERAVILQEIGQALDTPDDMVFDNLQEVAYPDQALGRTILGTPERVRGFGRDHLASYMSANYRAPTMILAATGGVDHDAVVDLAMRQFSGLANGSGTSHEPARYVGGDHRVERDLEQVHLVLGFDGATYEDPDFYAMQVYATLLGGGMSSRLFQEVREVRGLAYSIYAFAGSYVDTGLFGIYAGTGEAEAAEIVPVIVDEIARSAEHVSEEEVARARAQHKAGTLMSLESSSSRVEQLARQLLIFGRPIPLEEIVAKIDEVDPQAIRRVANRVFSTAAPSLAAIGPLSRLESYDILTRRFARPS